MGQLTHNELILQKISEKIKEAPHNWAEKIANEMEKSVESIYAYSRGERGVRKGYPVEVLKHLNTLIEERNQEIEKAIA